MFATPVVEASFISIEIKRLVAYSGGTLNYDDFAILRESTCLTRLTTVRYNALSRVIESALQKEGIPSRIIGGHKFFERMEIKDLLAYLQLADNPHFTVSFLVASNADWKPAFMRVVNTPRRGIGDKVSSPLFTKLTDLVRGRPCRRRQAEARPAHGSVRGHYRWRETSCWHQAGNEEESGIVCRCCSQAAARGIESKLPRPRPS